MRIDDLASAARMGTAVLVLPALYLASLYSYLLFHSLAEIFSIVVAAGIFMVAWNSRRILDNNYLLFIGIAYLFVGAVDLIHTLAYKGMEIFQGYNANLPTQLWIGGRFIESVTLFIAPLFIGRKLKINVVFVLYSIIFVVLLMTLFYWKVFPDCFIEGIGLTPFKKISEYVIVLILLAALGLLFQNRKDFDSNVIRYLTVSIIFTMASELAFTFYIDVYGLSNLVGHYFKIVSFYFVYKALVVTGLTKPYNLLFRNLKKSEEALRISRDELELRVKERTAELVSANRQLQEEVIARKLAEAKLKRVCRALKTVSSSNQAVIHATDEADLIDQICRIVVETGGHGFAWVGFVGDDERKCVQPVAQCGYKDVHLQTMSLIAPCSERDSSPTATAVQIGKPLIARNVPTDPHYDFWREEAARHGYSSSIALPLNAAGRTLGAMTIYSTELNAFDGEEVSLLAESADDLAYGIMALRTREEQNQAKEALRERERYFHSLLTHLHEDILVVGKDFRIRDVSKDFLNVVGRPRQEVVGRTCHEISHGCAEPCEEHGVRCLLQEVFATGHPQIIRHQHLLEGGNKVWVDCLFSLLKGEKGKDPHAIIAMRDATQEVKLDRHLQQVQKMEAIGTLAGGIAHDFNNVLGIILAYSELISFQISEESAEREYIEHIIKAAHRAKDLVKQILLFSRQGEHERAPLHLGPIIKETLKMLRAALPSTIEIRHRIETTPPGGDKVNADPTQFHQVLMNLCTNAGHAMSDTGGVLEISLSEIDFGPEDIHRPSDLPPGSYVRLAVGDTGCGIDPAILDRIFDPYFTTKNPGEGTGLGLAVVLGIVKGHGGAITVYSKPGVGTTFNVFLPRLKSTVATREVKPAAEEILIGDESILFVDDEVELVNAGRLILERLGYTVTGKTSSIEALEAFSAEPESFDLVVTDQTMPQKTGIELAGEILSIRPEIPVILCTGFQHSEISEKAKATGVRECLLKPLVIRELGKAVRRCLGDRRTGQDSSVGA